MTTTKSPLWRCGVKVGLCFPRKICAICDASRPKTCPSASIMYHFGSRSAALALYVFFIVHNSKRNRVASWHSFRMPNFKFFRISHSHQAEPVCRGCRARVRLICVLYDSSKFSKAETFLPHQQQRSDDPAHHPREKGVRGKITIDKCLCIPGAASL